MRVIMHSNIFGQEMVRFDMLDSKVPPIVLFGQPCQDCIPDYGIILDDIEKEKLRYWLEEISHKVVE